MTTIAYKDGILAADTCVTDSGAICGTATKLARAPNGAIAGASGNLASCAKFLSWFARDFGMVEKVAKIEGNSAALIIDKDGTVHTLDAGYPAFIINAPFHAIGSGSRIALGAMAAGASAEEAVRIACGIDDGTREPVETLRLNERELTEEEKAAFKNGIAAYQVHMADIAARTDHWANAVRDLPRTPDALAAAILHKQQQILRLKEDGQSVEELEFELSELKRHMNADAMRYAREQERRVKREHAQSVWSRIFRGLFR